MQRCWIPRAGQVWVTTDDQSGLPSASMVQRGLPARREAGTTCSRRNRIALWTLTRSTTTAKGQEDFTGYVAVLLVVKGPGARRTEGLHL